MNLACWHVFPSRKDISAALYTSFHKEIFSSTDASDAIGAFMLTSLGSTPVVFK